MIKIFHANYDLFYYLFYDHSPGWYTELLYNLIELIQSLNFILGIRVNILINQFQFKKAWNNNHLYEKIFNLIKFTSPFYFIQNRIIWLKIFLIISYFMIFLTMILYLYLLNKGYRKIKIQQYKIRLFFLRELSRICQKVLQHRIYR